MDLTFHKVEQEPKVQEVSKETIKFLVTQIEARYWLIGEYPDGQTIYNLYKIGHIDLKKMLPQINSALAKRDLPPYDPYKLSKEELSPEFVVAVNFLVDVSDKRSKSVKLKAVGLSTQKFNALLQNKLNKNYYEARAEQAFKSIAPTANLQLGKLVDSGDLQAIKYYHEVSGIHDPNRELNNNLTKLINLFMEVLSHHIPRDLIDTIASEFDVKMMELN